ncbi:MAG TPA: hypothetical protein VGA55_01855 [Bacteroidota bacterium]
MKTLWMSILIALVVILVPACDKSTDPGGEGNPELAGQKVDEADSLLIQKIILLVETGPDSANTDVSTVAALYAEALEADPSNADAHFGLALTDLISILPGVANATGGVSPFTFPMFMSMLSGEATTSSVLADMGAQLRERIQTLAKQQMETALGKRAPALVTGQAAGAASVQQELPSFYQNIIENEVLPHLTSAIGHLQVVTNVSGYAFLVTPAMRMEATGETYRIDHTEIYLLLAVLQGITAEASILVAYNVDYDPTDSAAVAQAWNVSSPFLGLRPNGAARMQNARTNLVGMASSIQGGLNHLLNEPPNPEADLINYNPADQPGMMQAIMILDTLKAVLSGPYAIPNAPTVNLKNFFDNAIPNYKAKVPAYTVSVFPGERPGHYDATLTWTATSFDAWIFPDPELNGLFPGMTDEGLKTLFGITSQVWTQEVLIIN